jgi:hypothetical protein
MVEKSWRGLIAAALLVAGLAGGCAADKQQIREQQLGDLVAWLPGKYDNKAQVAVEAGKSGHATHEAIALLIMPVNSPRLGHHVFFVQESVADDPRRILGSSMFSFDTDEKNGIVGLVYEFNEPVRWRDGLQHPELFTGLQAEDVSSAGCEFDWKKIGEEFVATHDPKRCHSLTPTNNEHAADLTPYAFSIGDYHYRRIAMH